jgi:hypothetical protein
MAETINKIIFDINGEEYEFAGGGGGQPGPDTVGTDEIIDGSVQEEDLSDDVKDKMTQTYSSENRTLYINGAKPQNE